MRSFAMNLSDKFQLFRSFSTNRTAKEFKALPHIKNHVFDSETPFGSDFQLTMNFLNRISKLSKIDKIHTETVQTCRNTSHSLYEALVHGAFTIPESIRRLVKTEFQNQQQVIFAGRGKSISAARRAALENLAKALYSVLSCANDLMPSSDSFNPRTSKIMIKADFAVPNSFQQLTEKFLEECSDLVSTPRNAPESNSVTPSLNERVSRLKNAKPLQGSLPIYKMAKEIVDSIDRNQVTILSATTGSGKTTQIPKILRHYFDKASIIVTQPRRVAAISLAERLAQEIDYSSVGNSVGYCVRFDAKYPSNKESNILFCTSGLLLKKLMNPTDLNLHGCTHLVLDEIHERDTNTDLLLLSVKNLLKTRPAFRVIIMSATLDADKFYHYFHSDQIETGRPIIIDSSTNYPIKTFHLENLRISKRGMDEASRNYIAEELEGGNAEVKKVPHGLVANVITEIHSSKPDGSILCFLPGWEDIVAVKALLETSLAKCKSFKIFCIHSSSSSEDTLSMFRPIAGVRKIILATNIAESSITIPDVVYVVDSGRQKILTYQPTLRMNSLEMTWISEANSLQRMGRAGRTQPGEYYRLWSKRRVLNSSAVPEILRVGLEDVCLTIKGLGFEGRCADITHELIDRPKRNLVKDAVSALIDIGALEKDSESITDLGRELAALPLGPRIGKALLVGNALDDANGIILLAAAVGERILKIPRFEEDRPAFFGHLRELRARFADDMELCLECLTTSNYDHLISRAAKRQSIRVAKSLSSQLRAQYTGSNPILSRLLWASAVYPNVAIKAPRRNEYLLGSGVTAEIPKESILYRESIETVIERGLDAPRAAPTCVVFEELFDAGYRMIMKASEIDPLAVVLFAQEALIKDGRLILDNFSCITGPQDAINALLALRECWKIGSKVIFKPDVSPKLIGMFKEILLTFISNWNPSRSITFTKLSE